MKPSWITSRESTDSIEHQAKQKNMNKCPECEKLHDEKTKAVNDYLLLQVYAEEDAETLQSLEKVIKTHYEYYSGFAAKKHLSSIQMLDTLFKSNLVYNHVDSKENECARYKAALEEIIKRPRRSETCKLIAQQALGLLNDDEHQPELLIEENLRLKIKIEDLQAVIDGELLNKVFP